jgi:hypothetical protein
MGNSLLTIDMITRKALVNSRRTIGNHRNVNRQYD